jgi:tripeptide aminopeptidase
MTAIAFDAQDRRGLLERFIRYVQVDTQSDENSTTSPSTMKQKDLGRLLADELKALGCADARMDEWGYVWATVPANLPSGHPAAGKVPAIGLIAHVDTYFATAGGGVRPQVIERYEGGDVTLPGDASQTITDRDNPNLAKCVGHTLITSDGTTLLGADDKAGVAEIMQTVAWMRKHPGFHHGEVKIAFTTDEEVGRGTEHFDVHAFGARYAYTLDGSDLGEIEDETFCADSAVVTIEGHDVHPGYAKGKMINAVRILCDLVMALPQHRTPETTEKREGYLHPINVGGNVSEAKASFIVRDFTEEGLRDLEDTLKSAAAWAERKYPGAKIEVGVKESYRNMKYIVDQHPQVTEYAEEGIRRAGLEVKRPSIRGGTDGARLTFMGVPTPNLSNGSMNFHGKKEWVPLEWMQKSVETVLHLMDVWVERSGTDAARRN